MAVYRAPDQAPKKKSPLGKILLIVLVQIFQSIGTALAKKLDKRLK
mgnify:CR=1 FL=1